MATIQREFEIDTTPDAAWAAIRDVGRINQLVAFLGDVSVDGDHRTCDLGDQGKLKELIVSVDDTRKRLAYSILDSPFNLEHHHATMQIVANGGTGAHFIWTTDVKPDEAVPALSEAIDHAVDSLKLNFR